MFDAQQFAKFVIALLGIMNPVAAVPVFISMTSGQSQAEQRWSAVVAALTVLITLAVSALAGRRILCFFGISLSEFRIAGGAVIFLMGLSMLHARTSAVHQTPEETAEGAAEENPAVTPIGVPLLVGPGSIATVILFAHQAGGLPAYAMVAAGVLIVSFAVYLVLRLGAPLAHAMGPTGLNIMTRLMGLIIAAIAVGMITAGIVDSIRAVAPAA